MLFSLLNRVFSQPYITAPQSLVIPVQAQAIASSFRQIFCCSALRFILHVYFAHIKYCSIVNTLVGLP